MKLKKQIKLMKKYLNMKRKVYDWHGVADAACDIRELEARTKERKNKK